MSYFLSSASTSLPDFFSLVIAESRALLSLSRVMKEKTPVPLNFFIEGSAAYLIKFAVDAIDQ